MLTAQYIGSGNYALTFDSGTEVILSASEMEEIKDRTDDIIYGNEIHGVNSLTYQEFTDLGEDNGYRNRNSRD